VTAESNPQKLMILQQIDHLSKMKEELAELQLKNLSHQSSDAINGEYFMSF